MENNIIKYEELETVDRECSERKVWKEKIKKTTTVALAKFILDDRDVKGTTTVKFQPLCIHKHFKCIRINLLFVDPSGMMTMTSLVCHM